MLKIFAKSYLLLQPRSLKFGGKRAILLVFYCSIGRRGKDSGANVPKREGLGTWGGASIHHKRFASFIKDVSLPSKLRMTIGRKNHRFAPVFLDSSPFLRLCLDSAFGTCVNDRSGFKLTFAARIQINSSIGTISLASISLFQIDTL